jgi:hypothetical protein
MDWVLGIEVRRPHVRIVRSAMLLLTVECCKPVGVAPKGAMMASLGLPQGNV